MSLRAFEKHIAGLQLATMLVDTITGDDEEEEEEKEDESIGRNDDHQQEVTRSQGSRRVQVSNDVHLPNLGAKEPWSSLQNVTLKWYDCYILIAWWTIIS